MHKIHIKDCTQFYNYGDINPRVEAECFEWKENETENILESIPSVMNVIVNRKYIYLMNSLIYSYPVGTINKYLGLWEKYKKDYNLQCYDGFEREVDLTSFRVYYGVASISKNTIKEAFEILMNDYEHSGIVLSDNRINLEEQVEEFIYFNSKKSNYYMCFNDFINLMCMHGEVITAINGYNGSTINYFYIRK